MYGKHVEPRDINQRHTGLIKPHPLYHGLVHDSGISSMSPMEIPQSCIKHVEPWDINQQHTGLIKPHPLYHGLVQDSGISSGLAMEIP